MKLFLDIVKDGDYMKVVKRGECDLGKAYDEWEKILRDYNKAAGSVEYLSYVDDLKAINSMLNELNMVRSMLTYLMFDIDDEIIEALRVRGFHVKVEKEAPHLRGAQAYAQSIADCLQNSNNLFTRINMKAKKINAVAKRKGEQVENPTYDDLVANLIMGLGFQVEEPLRLARYITLKKEIESREERLKNQRKNGRN